MPGFAPPGDAIDEVRRIRDWLRIQFPEAAARFVAAIDVEAGRRCVPGQQSPAHINPAVLRGECHHSAVEIFPGERSGRVFQLAGRVAVKVARVDLERMKIDFTLDENAQAGTPHPVADVRPAFAQPLARGHKRSDTRGHKRSDTRGGKRSDTRGDKRSDTRGDRSRSDRPRSSARKTRRG